MFFNKEEKVFSLSQVASTLPGRDIKTLFEEFYCFLLLAGLFREGSSVEDSLPQPAPICDQYFTLEAGAYNRPMAELITKGLKERFIALRTHPLLNAQESRILTLLERIFFHDKSWSRGLTGDDLYGVAIMRQFSNPMVSVARYVSVAFGSERFTTPVEIPLLYLSALGDIHLSKDNTVTLETPELPYGSRYNGDTSVTPLWALVSSLAAGLSNTMWPAEKLADILAGFVFLADPCEQDKAIPVPLRVAGLRMENVLGIDQYEHKVPVSASFYQSFLYGSAEERRVSRYDLLVAVLDLMVKKADDTDFELFAPNSNYRKLRQRSLFSSKVPKRPAIFQFALEALDASDEISDDPTLGDKTSTDPQTEDGGYDPTTPTPTTMETDAGFDPTAAAPTVDPVDTGSVNNIGLISFDKSGEGVDEHLYRNAVVALNDRLRDDDTIEVAAEVREALDYWVNGYLYLTSVSSTKDYIVALKLQKYLKSFNTRKNDQ